MAYLDVLKQYKSALHPYQEEVTEQKRKLEEALGQYTPRVGGDVTIAGKAQEALRKRDVQMAGFKEAQRGRETALAEVRPQMRAQYTLQPGEAGYVNPYRVESLISAAEEGRRAEITGLQDIMQTRMGTRQEAINSIIAAYQAGTERAKVEVAGRESMLGHAQQGLAAETGLVTKAYQQGYQETADQLAREWQEAQEAQRRTEWGQQFSYQKQQDEYQRAMEEAAARFQEAQWPTERAYKEALTVQALRPEAGPSAPRPTQWETEKNVLASGGADVLADYAAKLAQAASLDALQGMTIGGQPVTYETYAAKLRQTLAKSYPSLLGDFDAYVATYRPNTGDQSYFNR